MCTAAKCATEARIVAAWKILKKNYFFFRRRRLSFFLPLNRQSKVSSLLFSLFSCLFSNSLVVPKRARRRVGPPRRVTQSSNRVAYPTGQDQRARERRQRRGQGARVGRRGPAESDVESDGDRPRRLGPKQRLRDAGPGPGGDAGEKARACPLGKRREQAERGVGSRDEEVDRGVVGALSVEFFFFFLKEFLSKRRKKKKTKERKKASPE